MLKEQILKKVPGFAACLVIGLIAQGIAKFVPSVGAALFAIGIGMVCGNTFLNKPGMDAGTKFSERSLLEYSIVLTGATLVLSDIVAVGLSGVGLGSQFAMVSPILAIDPIIDMARTMLNVTGAMTNAIVVDKRVGTFNEADYKNMELAKLDTSMKKK